MDKGARDAIPSWYHGVVDTGGDENAGANDDPQEMPVGHPVHGSAVGSDDCGPEHIPDPKILAIARKIDLNFAAFNLCESWYRKLTKK